MGARLDAEAIPSQAQRSIAARTVMARRKEYDQRARSRMFERKTGAAEKKAGNR